MTEAQKRACKKYSDNNKEKIKAYQKEYYKNNPDKFKYKKEDYKRWLEWKSRNEEKLKEYHKQYYKQNKEKAVAQAKQYYKQNKKKVVAQAKQWRKEHPKYIRKYKIEYRQREPERIRENIRRKTQRAIIAGKIMKKDCEMCGNIKSQAHHPDYSQPLEVIFLCQSCHNKVHLKLKEDLIN